MNSSSFATFFAIVVVCLSFPWFQSTCEATTVVSQLEKLQALTTVSSLQKKLSGKHSNKSFQQIQTAVQGVIDRILTRGGVTSFKFQPTLELIPQEQVNGQLYDVFEIDGNSATNQVILRGSNAIALTTAFGHYLRYYTFCDVHWEDGGNYSLSSFPKSLSALPIPSEKKKTTFLSKYRYYQNTCTASYSFAWKDWVAYEADIDWMAINGYNLPLAFTGQEIVWQALWKENYGVSDQGMQEYFTGPAFLTWQRMANIRAYAGPLSDSWIQQQANLQRQILTRYEDLGMTPVMPAFNGVVPAEMQTLFPQANITRLPTWNDFPEEYSCNYILSSTDPLFVEIGKNFLLKQVEIYGEFANSHIYNADTFNENKPASSDPEYLSSSANAVYKSMISADPSAVWLMQGWLFVNDREFWTDDNIKSYLSGVPDDGMVILDLSSEDLPVYDKIAANNKQFIWCMLHNYGGSRALYGNITLLSTDPINVSRDDRFSLYFLGTGLTMEAIDQNPVLYEFMSEMAFTRDVTNTRQWIQNYALRRYNLPVLSSSEEVGGKTLALAAWEGLLHNNYEGETPVCHHPCYRRSILTLKPTWSLYQNRSMLAAPLVDIWSLFLAAGQAQDTTVLSDSNIAFSYDLVDVGRQVMCNLFYDLYLLIQESYKSAQSLINSDGSVKDAQQYKIKVRQFERYRVEMLALIDRWDQLLASHPSYLLGRWIGHARSWAASPTEADLFEFNARNQISLWGWYGEINDYAAKNWAGLAKAYYARRWSLFLGMSAQSLYAHTALDTDRYNDEVLVLGQRFSNNSASEVFRMDAVGSTVAITEDMQSKYGNLYMVHRDSKTNAGLKEMPRSELKEFFASQSKCESVAEDKLTAGDGYIVIKDSDTAVNDASTNILGEVPMWTTNIKQLEYLCDITLECVGFTTKGFLKKDTSDVVVTPGVELFLKKKC